MSTDLSRLRDDLEPALVPLLEAVESTLDALEHAPDQAPVGPALAHLARLRERLASALGRLAAERSYVLLFGPLKSGKSTLMNALGAAYVSEVTGLPAYPCMVYVDHAPDLAVSISRYDGTTEKLPDLAAMHGQIEAAHAELADALRAAEREGEEFDPAVHLPTAIRRVDVRLPAPELLASGAVLVDTPGLYTRMKFGYDQMTREFRDAAAAAVFVVKTDNLFLDSVFEEFGELLRLFSRIFLVVNLDAAKRDLAPDGGLGPSVEGRDPDRILRAFERLSMNAELARAREEGRLAIYGIDLLGAAAARLRGAQADAAAAPGAAADAIPGDAVTGEVPADFARFFSDLGDALNGSEVVSAFARDSLRQARDLLADVAAEARGATADAAADLAQRAAEQAAAAVNRRNAARRLGAQAWDRAFEGLRDDHTGITRERSLEVRQRTFDRADAAIDAWFENDQSFAALVDEVLPSVLAGSREALVELSRDVARTVLASDLAAAAVRRAGGVDVSDLGLSLAPLARAALDELPAWESGKSALIRIPTGLIPVRRTWIDWLLLRGSTAVRRRVFGPEEAPARAIPRSVKQRRMGAAARAAIGAAVRVRLDRFLSEVSNQVAIGTFGTSVAAVAQRVRAEIERMQHESERALAGFEAEVERTGRLRARIAQAAAEADRASARLGEIASRFGLSATEWDAPPQSVPGAASASGATPAGLAGEPADALLDPGPDGLVARDD